jgi:hypothetical protein
MRMNKKYVHILRRSNSRKTLCDCEVVEGLDKTSEFSNRRKISVYGNINGKLSNGDEVELWTVRRLRCVNFNYLGSILLKTCPECGEALWKIWKMNNTFAEVVSNKGE